jgi:hypothetical protein
MHVKCNLLAWYLNPYSFRECFKYLFSILTNDGRCTCENKFRIAMANVAFNENFLPESLDLNWRKKLVKCYIWSVALCGAET